MSDYVVSADVGNGNTCAGMTGVSKFVRFPSIRTRMTDKRFGMAKGSELEFVTARWKDETYAVGDEALLANRSIIDQHMGENRYGSEMHQFLTAYALACLGVKSGTVDLTLMCPPAFFNEVRQQMIDIYTKYPVKIALKDEKKPREWRYESVTVLPEGYAAAACLMLNEKGEESDLHKKLAGDVLIVDTGAFTTNTFRLHNFKPNPADLPKSSLPDGGGNAHIRQPMLQSVKDEGGDFRGVTVHDVDRVLRHGSIYGDYSLQFGQKKTDLKPMLDYLSRQYADWLANQLDTNFGSLREVNSILVVGGNAPYVTPYLQQWYGKVIEYTQLREFARLHPADLNAAGGLRLSQARLAAKK